MIAGLMMGAKIENYTTLRTSARSNATATQPQMSGAYTGARPSPTELPVVVPKDLVIEHRIDLSDVHREVLKIHRLIKSIVPDPTK
jgi:hypothetical protein